MIVTRMELIRVIQKLDQCSTREASEKLQRLSTDEKSMTKMKQGTFIILQGLISSNNSKISEVSFKSVIHAAIKIPKETFQQLGQEGETNGKEECKETT